MVFYFQKICEFHFLWITCERGSIYEISVEGLESVETYWKLYMNIFGKCWNWPLEGILFIKDLWIVFGLCISRGRPSVSLMCLECSENVEDIKILWNVFCLWITRGTSSIHKILLKGSETIEYLWKVFYL